MNLRENEHCQMLDEIELVTLWLDDEKTSIPIVFLQIIADNNIKQIYYKIIVLPESNSS